MGNRGPKPTPTIELKKRGSWLINNRADEPEPESSIPACPIWLKGEARIEWKRITKELSKLGMISELDKAVLVDYCRSWEEYCEACKMIDTGEYKDKFTETSGGKALHPALKLRDNAMTRIHKAASHFGLSPACRVGLKAQPKQTKDNKDRRTKLKIS